MTEYKTDIYQKIFFKILNYLSYKARTGKEIETKLNWYLSKEKSGESVKVDLYDRIMLQLEQDGYLNDKKVAQLYVESFINSPKAQSLRSFQNAMRKKGFSSEEIERSTGSLSPDLEKGRALKIAKKKLLSLKSTPVLVKKAKISNFLYSKGYSTATIKAVVDTLLLLQ